MVVMASFSYSRSGEQHRRLRCHHDEHCQDHDNRGGHDDHDHDVVDNDDHEEDDEDHEHGN